jgi:hypothetical protein
MASTRNDPTRVASMRIVLHRSVSQGERDLPKIEQGMGG